MATRTATKPSARERLLASANELFYANGVQSVGIDQIIEHAGVAKASLYNTFGSKEGLVRAYLESRRDSNLDRITRAMARFRTPRERLLGFFDSMGELMTAPAYNGCAFVAASAEAPQRGTAEQVAGGYRGAVRAILVDLAAEAGAPDPALLARKLHLLYDGASVSARMDHDPQAAAFAREAAEDLLDSALGKRD
ncbi:TetR/AcrR family transcriptional regulator [Actinacidiphila yeochonensis]|uniref:TetR/AcrR family transcriptional regulator n=1 Tax=Actinacidiphila yeochonensis TaxID=89050 RepID=UPI000563964A|nr:TetR/AcrR family transcriptional regulator [Actinacidiphila yeochonensis]